jgi:hypothetical protein
MPPISARAIGRCNWFPNPDPNSIGRVENNDAIATMIIGFSLLEPHVQKHVEAVTGMILRWRLMATIRRWT